MLNDLAGYRARLEQEQGRPLSESVAAYRWRAEVFEPAIAAVPPDLLHRRQPAEVYHEILQHRWFLSERQGADVGMQAAISAYVTDILPHGPDERSSRRSEGADPEEGMQE